MRELALMDLGVVYEQMGEYAKAVETYRQAGDLNGPQSNDARLAVARVMQHEGKRDAAIAAYQDFLKANPYAPETVRERSGRTRNRSFAHARGSDSTRKPQSAAA